MEKRTIEGEIEDERFLLLGSWFNLLCIDLKKTEEKYGGKCSQLSYDPPLAEVVWTTNLHATSDFLPLGMSSTKFNFKTPSASSLTSNLNNDILLIGGELQDPSTPYFSTHTSKELYKLIPEVDGVNGDLKDIRIEVADATIPRMRGGKAYPIVEEIGGNLYVLHSRFVYASIFAQAEIPFEVFESKTGEWRTLPVPPFSTACSGTVIYSHVVFGQCLVVETSRECFYFDTVREEWYCSMNMTSHLINRLPMIVPSGLPCFGLDEKGRELVVGISLMIEPCAYLAALDGTIFSCQSLYHLIYKDIIPFPYPATTRNFLIPLNSRQHDVIRLCACSFIAHNDLGHCLLVSFFSCKISTSSQQLILKMISGELPNSSLLDVVVERKFILKVPLLGSLFDGPTLLL